MSQPIEKVVRIATLPADPVRLQEAGIDVDSPLPGISDAYESAAWQNLFDVLNSNYGSRYSDGSFGIAYTASHRETAIVEKGYWVRKLIFDKPNAPNSLNVMEYSLNIYGQCKDYTSSPLYDPELTHPHDYQASQAVGRECWRMGVPVIKVPSARRNGGINYALLAKDVLPELKPATISVKLAEYRKKIDSLFYISPLGETVVEIEPVYPNWAK